MTQAGEMATEMGEGAALGRLWHRKDLLGDSGGGGVRNGQRKRVRAESTQQPTENSTSRLMLGFHLFHLHSENL